MLKRMWTKHGRRLIMGAVAASALSVPAMATSGDNVAAMQTAFEAIKADMLAGVGVIAPIAIGVCGAILLWRFGVRFFKSIAK